MVDTISSSVSSNGQQTRVLPDMIHLTQTESQRIPSPGTQRALKAETGRSWTDLVGPDADSADRIQTMIWIQLRRTIPDLHWDECADVDVQVEEGATIVDPTNLGGSVSSPASAGSGG
jgi:hypothetical protein